MPICSSQINLGKARKWSSQSPISDGTIGTSAQAEKNLCFGNGLDYYCVNPCHQFQQSAEPFLLNVFCCCLTVFQCNLLFTDNLAEGSFHILKTKPTNLFPVIFNSKPLVSTKHLWNSVSTWNILQFCSQFIKGHTGVLSWSVLNQTVLKPTFQLTYVGKSKCIFAWCFLFVFSPLGGGNYSKCFTEIVNKCSSFGTSCTLNNLNPELFVLGCQLWSVSSHHQQTSSGTDSPVF